MSTRRTRVRRATAGLAFAAAVAAGLSACQGSSPVDDRASGPDEQAAPAQARPDPVRVTTRVGGDVDAVPVDQPVRVTARDGRLTSVRVSSGVGELRGRLSADGAAWTAKDR